jgi:peptidoglycan/xylan/chitin deacetylase (PgdA/CDA1 family)
MSQPLVLCYHAVSESWDCELAVTPAQLRSQVDGLLARGYRPATFLDATLAPPRSRLLAITFDDAYRSVFELARPILAELGVVASVYAPTEWIGSGLAMRWPGIDQWIGTADENELLPMNWGQLRELAAEGWEVGSHTCSHPHLTELDDASLMRELEDSRSACATQLAGTCETIAYPYGDVDERVVAAAGAAGYSAAGALPPRWHAERPLEWPRVGVYHGDDERRFAVKASPLVRRIRGTLGR